MRVDLWLKENPYFDIEVGDLYRVLSKDGSILCVEKYTTGLPGITKLDDLLEINFDTREIHRENLIVSLTPAEYKILYHLAQNVNCVVAWQDISNILWGYEAQQSLRVVIARIRDKLGERSLLKRVKAYMPSGTYLQTYFGYGYRLKSYVK